MAAPNEDGRNARAAEWLAAWDRQDRTLAAQQAEESAEETPESVVGPPRAGGRHGLFAFGLLCAAAAVGLSLAGQGPALSSAQAFAEPPAPMLGAWVGDCRSGETRSVIPLAIELEAGVPRLIWSRYSYTLAQDAPTEWSAYRDGERVGRLTHADERLHVRMDNFRCGWIEAKKPAAL